MDLDFASPHTEEAYTSLWLAAVFAQMRAERERAGWREASAAWFAIERYASALGNELDARVFRGLAEEAEAAAMIADVVNNGGGGPSDGT